MGWHYAALEERFRRIAGVQGALAILDWDTAVVMPKKAAPERGDQLAALKRVAHDLLVHPETGEQLAGAEAEADLEPWQAANLREMRRKYRHAHALEPAMVEALARATTACEMTWREARANADFPMLAPQLEEVNAYLGWFGPLSRAMQVTSGVTSASMKLPGASRLWDAVTGRFVKGSTGGPDAEARAKQGSYAVAVAYDRGGAELAEVHVSGVDGYTYTGRMLAWGAERAAAGGLEGSGALGPVEAFGLDELEAGSAEAGISVAGDRAPARAAA